MNKMNKIEILQEFAKCCDKKMLNYYLYGKTLYDAMKHERLPENNQPLTVVMPREDFDRMHRYNEEKKISEKCELTGLNAGKGYLPYARFGVSKTQAIDIYPLDGIPSDEKKFQAHIDEINTLKEQIDGSKKGIVAKIKGLFESKKPIAEQIDKLARKYEFDEKEYVAVTVWNSEAPGKVNKADFLAPYIIKIDGVKYNGTAAYYTYLTEYFGEI